MLNLNIKSYLKLIFIISLVSIISAYFIEHILGHQPCNLCLIERIPYGISIILIISNYFFKNKMEFFSIFFLCCFAGLVQPIEFQRQPKRLKTGALPRQEYGPGYHNGVSLVPTNLPVHCQVRERLGK